MAIDKSVPSTVKFPIKIVVKIREASQKTGLSQLEIIRLCVAIGLEDLEKVNFDIPRLVSDAVAENHRK